MSQVVKTQVTDAIPDEVFGFKVQITQGPLKNPETGLTIPGRYGVYATLTPGTEALRQKLVRVKGADAILGMCEYNPRIYEEAEDREQADEFLASMALAQALRHARLVDSAS